MTMIQTAIIFCATCLVAIVAYGAIFIDPKFTILLLPPLVAIYVDERYLPESVTQRLQNPKPMEKVFLALLGLYLGLRITGCNVDGALQNFLGIEQKGGGGQEL